MKAHASTPAAAISAVLFLLGAAPAAEAKGEAAGGQLTVCKFVGPGVSAQKRFKFTASGRSFRLAATSAKKGGCKTLRFAKGSRIRVKEGLPAANRVAITARPAKALLERDQIKGSATIRLQPGRTRVHFTNVDCDEAAEIRGEQPVLPPGAEDVEAPVDVNIDRGALSDLYPGVDTSTDEFYPLPCESSIGGTLPPSVDDPPSVDEIEGENYLKEVEPGLAPIPVLAPPDPVAPVPAPECLIKKDPPSPAADKVPCDSPKFLHHDQPFEGRDVIYVHGLATKHLEDYIKNLGPEHRLWPTTSEYLNPFGYYRQYAEDYWRPHIREHLWDSQNPSNLKAGWQWTQNDAAPVYKRKSNRYLAVAWSSAQTLEYSQHALLTQIQLAIASNTNVKTSPTYPKTEVRPFCSNGCILVSHSTGALLVSTAMARAAAGDYGPGGVQIAKRMRQHVSFAGAISGSRLASAGIAIGLAVQGAKPNALCAVMDAFLEISGTCGTNLTFLTSSIFRDLVPAVAQGYWGPVLSKSPVPTVTVAGGHPVGNYRIAGYGATKWLLPGLDDGVVSMNSACGNPNPVHPGQLAPSGATMTSLVKAFEFSKSAWRVFRGVRNFKSHLELQAGPPGLRYLAGACTPYRSPTGLVMPVSNPFNGTPLSTRTRYPNHYSMLQGSIDHGYDGATETKPGSPNPWPSNLGLAASTPREYQPVVGPNYDETSAVTDAGIYKKFGDGTHLVHPAFGALREVVEGRKITFKFFKKKKVIWIWKRTYHLLDRWQTKQSSHYVYEFAGKG